MNFDVIHQMFKGIQRRIFEIFEKRKTLPAFSLLTLMITLYKYVASQCRVIFTQLKFVFIEIISTRKNNIDFFGFDAANFFM